MTDKELLRAYATAMYSYTVADVYSEAEKLADKKSTSLEDEILQRMAIPAAQPAPGWISVKCEYCWHYISLENGEWLDGAGNEYCPEPGETKHRPAAPHEPTQEPNK